MSVAPVQLPAPYRDARARDLGLALGLPPQPALLVRVVTRSRLAVELRVLGASHQVLLLRDGRLACSETVACGVDSGGLPGSREWQADTLRCRFLATTSTPRPFAAEVGALLASLTGDRDAACAVFPGHPLAATGLRVRFADGGATWQTWHTYPQTGEIVTTTTTAELA